MERERETKTRNWYRQDTAPIRHRTTAKKSIRIFSNTQANMQNRCSRYRFGEVAVGGGGTTERAARAHGVGRTARASAFCSSCANDIRQ